MYGVGVPGQCRWTFWPKSADYLANFGRLHDNVGGVPGQCQLCRYFSLSVFCHIEVIVCAIVRFTRW